MHDHLIYDLGLAHMYTMLINDVAQVMDLFHVEVLFFKVGVYLVLSQDVKNLLNMMQVLFPSLVVNEKVIQIHHYKIIGEWLQDIIHCPHESG
jgi:hypothetical protein